MFSDGVIAIAITLLVLQIHVPHTEQGGLLDALLDQWPSYIAFIISFVVIGIMWVSHHSMFERIAAVDRGLLFINLLLLLGIAFLPFPTDLVATYIQDGGANSHIAAAIYSVTMVAIGFAFTGMWFHCQQAALAARRRHSHRADPRRGPPLPGRDRSSTSSPSGSRSSAPRRASWCTRCSPPISSPARRRGSPRLTARSRPSTARSEPTGRHRIFRAAAGRRPS